MNCKKCGLKIKFKMLDSGKHYPVNPDGSDHFDICKETRNKVKSTGRIDVIASEWITGKDYVKSLDRSCPFKLEEV